MDGIYFGALSKPIHEQIGKTEAECSTFQRMADNVTFLHLHDIITDSETHHARNRIIKRIEKKFIK